MVNAPIEIAGADRLEASIAGVGRKCQGSRVYPTAMPRTMPVANSLCAPCPIACFSKTLFLGTSFAAARTMFADNLAENHGKESWGSRRSSSSRVLELLETCCIEFARLDFMI